jgi:hypothetical protein
METKFVGGGKSPLIGFIFLSLMVERSAVLLAWLRTCDTVSGMGCRTFATNETQTAYIRILFHAGNVESISSACVNPMFAFFNTCCITLIGARLREWYRYKKTSCVHISTVTSTCSTAAVFSSHPHSLKKFRFAYLCYIYSFYCYHLYHWRHDEITLFVRNRTRCTWPVTSNLFLAITEAINLYWRQRRQTRSRFQPATAKKWRQQDIQGRELA